MRIKSKVWYWLAVASGCVGMLYALGVEGTMQVGGNATDSQFVTAFVLVLLAAFFARLGFAAEAEEKRRRKVHRTHARKPEYPESQERGA